jgi:hypothetical protein
MRNEVGLELRALLTEALNDAAAEACRPPDRELTLEVLSKFGRPDVMAARYAPRGFHVIEPEHASWFIRLAVVCVALQWALTLPRVFTSAMTVGQWWLGWGLGAFWWVGLLTVYFAAAGWVQRRSPLDDHSFVRPWTHYIFWVPFPRDWMPPDQEEKLQYAGNSGGQLVTMFVFALLIIFFVSPAGFLEVILPEGSDVSWLYYETDFRSALLAPLLALMAVRLALFTLAVLIPQWRAPTEPLRFALWIAFIALLGWVLIAWDIFQAPATNFFFKAWLSVFLIVNCIVIVVFIRRALTRVRVPSNLRGGGR